MAQYNNTAGVPERARSVPKDIYSDAGLRAAAVRGHQAVRGPRGQGPVVYPFWTSVWPDPALASEIATLQTNLEQLRARRTQLAFITGSKNIDTDWDAYVKGLDSTRPEALPGDPAAGLRQVQVREQVALHVPRTVVPRPPRRTGSRRCRWATVTSVPRCSAGSVWSGSPSTSTTSGPATARATLTVADGPRGAGRRTTVVAGGR